MSSPSREPESLGADRFTASSVASVETPPGAADMLAPQGGPEQSGAGQNGWRQAAFPHTVDADHMRFLDDVEWGIL